MIYLSINVPGLSTTMRRRMPVSMTGARYLATSGSSCENLANWAFGLYSRCV
jgi:hypothetical protein